MSDIYTSAEGARTVEAAYRELLETWPVPAEHLRVPTREGETFVIASGPPDAPPLLLLHGSGANSAVWLGDVAAWSEHFRVYSVDVIGEPGLSAPSRPPMRAGGYTPWLDDVVAALGVTRISVVAISLGGWVALDYATHHPEQVERLALLCPTGISRQKWAKAVAAALLLRPLGRWGKRKSVATMLGPVLDTLAPSSEDFVQLVARNYRYRQEPVPLVDDDALRRVTMPVLAVVGARDAMVDSRGIRDRLGRLVPSATVRVLPDAGHLLPAQTEPVLEFMREARARS